MSYVWVLDPFKVFALLLIVVVVAGTAVWIAANLLYYKVKYWWTNRNRR